MTAAPATSDLRAQLAACLAGRACLVGLGNPGLGDDGLGVALARAVAARLAGATPAVVDAGAEPERHLGAIAAAGHDAVLFLDAVEFGAEPGAAVLLGAAEIQARFPQVSTHKLSLGVLACLVEQGGRARAWLLGVQPGSLAAGAGLSPDVRATVDVLAELLAEVGAAAARPAPEKAP